MMEVKEYLLDALWADPRTMFMKRLTVECEPFPDQSLDTGSIRRPNIDVTHDRYIQMWVQALLTYLGPNKVADSTWIVGGDGRFGFCEAFYKIVSVIAAHKVERIVTAKDGLLTTAAMSLMIKREKALCGIMISSSDFDKGPSGIRSRIRLSVSSGRAASDSVMRNIYETSKTLKGYKCVVDMTFPLNEHVSFGYKLDGKYTTVTISDVAKLYGNYMETIFDFKRIKNMLSKSGGLLHEGFRIMIDCMYSSGGPFAIEIFETRLGCPQGTVIHAEPQECPVGAGPPQPDLRTLEKFLKEGKFEAGFAVDSNGDRVMVLGRRGILVCSGDSIAILAAHLHCIPYFQVRGISGIARTLSTSSAVDRVAWHLKIPLYEVPVELSNICDLMEEDLVSFFGDEQYGMGSPHLMEKDGIWGVLAWLSVLEHMKLPIHELLLHHWRKYGRSFSVRMDYNNVEETVSSAMMNAMEKVVFDPQFFGSLLGNPPFEYTVHLAENFVYEDPTGKERSTKIGVKIVFNCKSRIIYRVSHLASNVFRLYLEHFTQDSDTFRMPPIVMTKELFKIATELSQLKKYLGRVEASTIV